MSKEVVRNYGKSIRGKLLNIAKNENIYYQTVLTRYFQERLLYRISQTSDDAVYFLKVSYFRAASAMTFSLRAMKSERALPLRRPLERRARSITCLRMSLPAAYSLTTASWASFIA